MLTAYSLRQPKPATRYISALLNSPCCPPVNSCIGSPHWALCECVCTCCHQRTMRNYCWLHRIAHRLNFHQKGEYLIANYHQANWTTSTIHANVKNVCKQRQRQLTIQTSKCYAQSATTPMAREASSTVQISSHLPARPIIEIVQCMPIVDCLHSSTAALHIWYVLCASQKPDALYAGLDFRKMLTSWY